MSELARLTAAAEETVVEERRRRVWPEMWWFLKGRKREKDLR